MALTVEITTEMCITLIADKYTSVSFIPQLSVSIGLSSCLHMPSKYVKNDMVSAHQKLLLLPCLWPIAQQSHRKVDKLGKCGSDKSVAVFLKATSQVKRQKIVFLYHFFDKADEHLAGGFILSFGSE